MVHLKKGNVDSSENRSKRKKSNVKYFIEYSPISEMNGSFKKANHIKSRSLSHSMIKLQTLA